MGGLLGESTVRNMLPLLTKCACWAFAFGNGAWSAVAAELLRATNILEGWVSTLCKAPDGCPNTPQKGSKFCFRHGGGNWRDCTECNGTAKTSDSLCISCGGGKRCTFTDCKSGCSGCRDGEMLCFKHGGKYACREPGCNSYRSREHGHSTQFCLQHREVGSRRKPTPFQTFRQRQVDFLVRVEGWRGPMEESSDANNDP